MSILKRAASSPVVFQKVEPTCNQERLPVLDCNHNVNLGKYSQFNGFVLVCVQFASSLRPVCENRAKFSLLL